MERKIPGNSSTVERPANTSYFLDNSGNLSVILTNFDQTTNESPSTEKWINICQQQQTFAIKIEADTSKDDVHDVRAYFLSLFPEDQKAPLSAILDFARLMQSSAQHIKSDSRHLNIGAETQFILDGIIHLQDIIKEKLKPGLTKQPLESEKNHDLFSEIDKSIQSFSLLCKKKNIVINNNAEITKSIYVKDSEFKPIFQNVLFNALQWNVCDTQINISYKIINAKNLRIKITSPASPYAKNIVSPTQLQPFNEIDLHTYMLEGSGIGVIIANKLIEFIGGGFSVNFKNGSDNIFDLILPITELGNKKIIARPQCLPSDEYKILYIEDNEAHIQLVSHILKRLPRTNLISALMPEQGLALAKSIQPDLILLDIRFQEMDGYEVLKQLQACPATQDIPVIALSAAAMTHEVAHGLRMGFKHYLTKPFHIKEFINLIEQELASIPVVKTENL